ncbi:MAG: LysE family transporter [Candidatus Erginobacter occultus]|nr:LysE family transporter [Candidatus Erginobacter occultus]
MKIFGLAFIVALTGAMSPGPLLAVVVGQVLARGPLAVVYLLLGHAFLEAVLVAGLARGLGRWLKRAAVRSGLGIVGGGVLIWMGWSIAAAAGEASLAGSRGSAMSALTLFLAGIGASLSNPYFTGWWATVGTGQMATLNLRGRGEFTLFLLGHELGDFSWYLLVAAALTAGRGWLTDDIYRALLWGAGAVVALIGIVFIGIGARLLLKKG